MKRKLQVVLFGCETLSLISQDEHKFIDQENKILQKDMWNEKTKIPKEDYTI